MSRQKWWTPVLYGQPAAESDLDCLNSATIFTMSKLTDLFKKRRALIAEGNRAFAAADKIEEKIAELVNDVFGGDDTPRQKLTPRQRQAEREVEEVFKPVFRPKGKGRTPSLLAPIREVLEHYNNEPITQEKLLVSLAARGVEVKGKKPKSTLSAHVSYLIKKNILVRVGDRIALKQPQLVSRVEGRTH